MRTLFHMHTSMFDVVKCISSSHEYGYSEIPIWHKCGDSFVGHFHNKQYLCGDPSAVFTCPHCGEKIESRDYTIYARGSVPVEMWIELVEGVDFIDIRFSSRCVYMNHEESRVINSNPGRKEHIRFDFKRRKVLFVKFPGNKFREEIELNGNKNFSFNNNELMSFILSESHLKNKRKELQTLVRLLINAFRERMERITGYAVKDLYVPLNFNNEHGALYNLVRNLAWKMQAPDAPKADVRFIRKCREFSVTNPYNACQWFIPDEVITATRKGESFIRALMRYANLPNTRLVRRMLSIHPGLYAIMSGVLEFTNNPSLQNRILKTIMSEFNSSNFKTWSRLEVIKCWPFLKVLKAHFSEVVICKYFENAVKGIGSYKDDMRLFDELFPETIEKFKNKQIKRPRDIHDTLMSLYQSQKNGEFSLPTLTKYEGSVNGLKFISPQKASTLINVGEQMHICVGSYAKDVARGNKAVVIVANDVGEWVACLELAKDEHGQWSKVIQAKLHHNIIVRKNKEVFSGVCRWMQQHQLQPQTIDIGAIPKGVIE